MPRHLPQVRCNGRSNCVACPARHWMVCSEIAPDDLVCFGTGVDDFSFGRHATIFEMGAPIRAVYFIRAGVVKMVRHDLNGGERIVQVLKKGDIAGLESASTSHHGASAVATGDVRACRIPLGNFQHVVAKHPRLQGRLFEKSQAALREAETWLADFVGGILPIRARVARLLLHLRDGDADRIHRFCLDDMAAIIGSTRETVSRAIAEFMRQGLLTKDDNLAGGPHFCGDIAALTKIAEGGAGSTPGCDGSWWPAAYTEREPCRQHQGGHGIEHVERAS